jgi:bla regulator protein BlaR1
MFDWLISQQLAISVAIVMLLIVESKGLSTLGAKLVYSLWLLLPLILIANNLPQALALSNDNTIYQYVVLFGARHETELSINWTIIWALGALVLLAYVLYSQWKINRLIPVQSTVAKLPLPLPIGLKAFTCQQISGPVLSGIFAPKLLLPENFFVDYSPRQQELILQHEFVHYRRGDNISTLVFITFVALFWFNPLIWLAYQAFRRSQEMACDAAVLRTANTHDKVSYSKALLQCAERPLQHFAIYSPYGEKQTMYKRISLIKNNVKVKPSLVALVAILAGSLLASVAFAHIVDTKGETSQQLDESYMARPIMRVEPHYPIQAAKDKINGSVVLEFDIEADGSTGNIRILRAEPELIFDQVAKDALKQWQYKPKISGGAAMKQTGLKVQLDFRMDEGAQSAKSAKNPSAVTHERITVQNSAKDKTALQQ